MMQRKKIVFYNVPPDMTDIVHYPVLNGFEITAGKLHINDADAVIFHMPSMHRDSDMFLSGVKRPGQIWVFWSNESEMRHRWQYHPEIYDLFDIKASYKLNADVSIPYFYANYFGLLRNEPAPKTKFINALISGSFNHSGRLEYLKEFMSYVQVDSFGKMYNNRAIPPGTDKQRLIAPYKFTIAFENAISEDYVTEHFFDPLIAGSVPIYLGAPNVDDFAPGDKCYIDARSFSSMGELADLLVKLNNDDEAYMEYLQWKTRPYRLQFNLKAAMVARHPLVKLCMAIGERMTNSEMII